MGLIVTLVILAGLYQIGLNIWEFWLASEHRKKFPAFLDRSAEWLRECAERERRRMAQEARIQDMTEAGHRCPGCGGIHLVPQVKSTLSLDPGGPTCIHCRRVF